VSKDTKPLDQARTEVAVVVAQQQFAKAMQQIDHSAVTVLNDAYFQSGPESESRTAKTRLGGQ